MSGDRRQFDVIVLGAGAAGLLCAATAGQRGRRVAVVEQNGQPGRKILVSGGGRANFTNRSCSAANYLSSNPHFAKSALALYRPEHFLELVERYGIGWHEKTLGQLFCDGSARQIVAMLQAECERGRVGVLLGRKILAVERAEQGGFRVETTAGELRSEALVVATGGRSIPQMGATGIGYELASRFGLGVIEPRPALVPLVLGGEEKQWSRLAGLALAVEARVGKVGFREQMLFTHRGLSGPAILQISSYWRPGMELEVDFAPGGVRLLDALERKGAVRDRTTFRQALRERLPQRLASFVAECAAPRGWTNAELSAAESRLHGWKFHPAGTEGFDKAEVTAGGVDTHALEARTMESRQIAGLFFVGEVVDVTGWLGGYNLQWAWSSGVAAGRSL